MKFLHIPRTGGTTIKSVLSEGQFFPDHPPAKSFSFEDQQQAFTFVRDPYARAVSLFRFLHKGGVGETPREFRQLLLRTDGGPSLAKGARVLFPQAWWLLDDDGELLVHDIARHENLQEECLARGIDIEGVHLNAARTKRPWKSYYKKNDCAELVFMRFRKDFELFGYDPKSPV